eukprot:TRINITY_DN7103_c0_g5_i1.p1 TRINITY_DN7103_c0_g5~~TRINITY_DN7103_c0_g5_i1.p1  ORF type:complete len:213 (-),score=93.66 TRINITY_DN7103_c0_g5_i1:131-724(-)
MCIRDRYKVIIVGEASVGKSCLLIRATEDTYSDNYSITIGADSSTFLVKIGEAVVQLEVWDTAGSEKYRSMIKVFFAGSHAAFIAYDITRKDTFNAVDFWLDAVRQTTSPEVKVVLVGNKKDEEEKREVTQEEANEYLEMNELFAFMETSAKTGEGVMDVFKKLAQSLYDDDENTKRAPAGMKLREDGKSDEGGGCC